MKPPIIHVPPCYITVFRNVSFHCLIFHPSFVLLRHYFNMSLGRVFAYFILLLSRWCMMIDSLVEGHKCFTWINGKSFDFMINILIIKILYRCSDLLYVFDCHKTEDVYNTYIYIYTCLSDEYWTQCCFVIYCKMLHIWILKKHVLMCIGSWFDFHFSFTRWGLHKVCDLGSKGLPSSIASQL